MKHPCRRYPGLIFEYRNGAAYCNRNQVSMVRSNISYDHYRTRGVAGNLQGDRAYKPLGTFDFPRYPMMIRPIWFFAA